MYVRLNVWERVEGEERKVMIDGEREGESVCIYELQCV